ncbi:MAG: hypothetical protein HY819_12350 [Acidobacteria bacterium]|nr:hypothetical protein [Acidobacteriota bacterium]
MAKLLDKEGIASFQKIYQLSQEIADEPNPKYVDLSTQNNQIIHFWDFEEEQPYQLLIETKQVA